MFGISATETHGKITPEDPWIDKEIILFLKLYEENMKLLSTNKSKFWKTVISGLQKYNYFRQEKECADKFKELREAYKKSKDNNDKKTGTSPSTCPFYKVSNFINYSKTCVII